MSVVEEQAKELGVGAAGGAKDGGQKRDTMIVSVGMLILIDFLLGGFMQRLVDVGRVSKLACFGRIVLGGSPALVGDGKVEDQVSWSAVVVKVVFDLHVAALLASACCDGCLDAHLMAQRAEEWLELCDCPVVGLGGRGYRLAAVHMVGVGAEEVLSTGAKHARVVHQNRNRYAKGPRELR